MENWFRVHTSILDSRKFERISLAARGLWMSIGALVKERGDPQGRLVRRDGSPMDAERLAREIGYPASEVSPFLSELIDAGLVEIDEDGYLRMHDWWEWQAREDRREQWREQKRKQKLERNGSEGAEREAPEEQSEIPQVSTTFQEVPQASSEFRNIPHKSKSKSESKSENNTSRSASRASAEIDHSDPDVAFIIAKYQQHGLSPPDTDGLLQEKNALLMLESERKLSRMDISKAADWMFISFKGRKDFGVLYRRWDEIAEQMARRQRRGRACAREEALPAYYRRVEPPPEWGGLQ